MRAGVFSTGCRSLLRWMRSMSARPGQSSGSWDRHAQGRCRAHGRTLAPTPTVVLALLSVPYSHELPVRGKGEPAGFELRCWDVNARLVQQRPDPKAQVEVSARHCGGHAVQSKALSLCHRCICYMVMLLHQVDDSRHWHGLRSLAGHEVQSEQRCSSHRYVCYLVSSRRR